MCKKCLIITIIFLLTVIAGFFIVLNTKAQGSFSVVINEVAWMGYPIDHVESKQHWRYEWIELYNTSDYPIVLNGWTVELLRDEIDFVINLNGTVAQSDFLVAGASDKLSFVDVDYDNLGGKFINGGQKLILRNNQGAIVEQFDARPNWFEAGDNNTKQSMERKNPNLAGSDPANWATSKESGGTPKAKNSVYQTFSEQNPPNENSNTIEEPTNNNDIATETSKETVIHGAQTPQSKTADNFSENNQSINNETATSSQNEDAASASIETQSTLFYPSNIYINELMPSPTGDDSLEEWIEITNENNEQINLSGWQIRDTKGVTNTYTLPLGSIIGAKGFLVLSRTTTNITLNNDSDGLELLKPSGEIAQTINYESSTKGFSYIRFGDKWTWSGVPTPGSINILSQPEKEKASVKSIDNSYTPLKTKKLTKTMKDKNIATNTASSELLNATSADAALSKTASIADPAVKLDSAADADNNFYAILLALFISAVSGCAIFILKKRVTQ